MPVIPPVAPSIVLQVTLWLGLGRRLPATDRPPARVSVVAAVVDGRS